MAIKTISMHQTVRLEYALRAAVQDLFCLILQYFFMITRMHAMPPLPKHLNLWPENVSFLKTFITLTYIWMRKTDIPQNESLLCVEDVTKLLVCFFFVLLGYFPLESTDHRQNEILHDTLPMDHRNISAPLNLSTRLQFHLK